MYLTWRAGFTMHDTPLWLSAPTFALEVLAFIGALALTWALWPAPTRGIDEISDDADATLAAASTIGLDPVDVVLRVDRQELHEVRATLLALRSVRHTGTVRIVDLRARETLVPLAHEFDAEYLVAERYDRHGLATVMSRIATPVFLLLDAGDIPTTDLVGRLAGHLADPRVAVVQGQSRSLAEEAPGHGPDRRRDLMFERAALNPALGRRGVATWTGSGSLVRTRALHDTAPADGPALEVQWEWSADLLAAGWKIVAPSTAVLAQRNLVDELALYTDRIHRARAARRLVFGGGGALRPSALRPKARLALVAWGVRPLSGLRRVMFFAVLCGVLLSGTAPFHATWQMMAFTWLPALLYTSAGLAFMSGWTLRPGDRTRWSLHTIGPACNGLLGDLPEDEEERAPVVVAHSFRYGGGLLVAVLALSIVLMMRAVSELATHTLGEMSSTTLIASLLVGAWVLALSLDLLRLLNRRGRVRRIPRVASTLAATLGDHAVTLVDVAARGAGVVGYHALPVGSSAVLHCALPTRTGVTEVRVSCRVNSNESLAPGEWRRGIVFEDVDAATANALAEFCAIEPMWERLGALPGRSITEVRPIVYVPDPDDEVWDGAGWSVAGQSSKPS